MVVYGHGVEMPLNSSAKKYLLYYVFRAILLIFIFTLSAVEFPQSSELISKDMHNPALECPEMDVQALKGRFDFEIIVDGLKGQKTMVHLLWNDDELGPQVSPQSEIFIRTMADIARFYKEHFYGYDIPAEINIVQLPLGTGIGALYCRSYQASPDEAVTLFFSHKSLESFSEFSRLIAHELTHHWFFSKNKNASSWIEEGIAYLSEYLVTGRLSGKPVIQFMNNADASLTQMDIEAPMRQMGQAQLLMVYLYDKLGNAFLDRLLASQMNGINSLNSTILKENSYGWTSFRDAFRDFQIAKYVNRQDYLATTDLNRDRYFLFPTTIRAKTSTAAVSREWSAQEYSQKTTPMSKNLEYEDLLVTDDPSQPISVKPFNQSKKMNERVFRILYQAKGL